MAAPTLNAEGTLVIATTGDLTISSSMPTHAADDILLMAVGIWAPNTGTMGSIPAPTTGGVGWNALGEVTLVANDGLVAWFWRRAAASGETATCTRGSGWDTGTDTAFFAVVDAIRGCETTGNPYDATATLGPYTTANQNIPGVTVSGAERLVVISEINTQDSATVLYTAQTGYTMGTSTSRGATTGTGGQSRTSRIETGSTTSAAASTHGAPAAGRHYAFRGVSFKPPAPDTTPIIVRPEFELVEF